MSTPLLKLYKGSYTNAEILDRCNEGAIVFDNTNHRIYAGKTGDEEHGYEPIMFGSNVQDVTFSNSILTITKIGSADPITLNFSDIASASNTMAVFQALYNKIGLTGDGHDQIDYTNTNYLSDLGKTGEPAKNLVNADKALDTAIKEVSDKVDDLDVTEYEQGVIDTATSQTETTVSIKSIKEVDGKISAGTATTNLKLDGVYNANTNKIATESTVENAVKMAANSPAQYDTTSSQISQDWITVVNTNAITAGQTFEVAIDEVDKKVAGLADELIKDEQVTQEAVSAIANSVGLNNDLSIDLSNDTTGTITNDKKVKDALIHLAGAVSEAGKVDEVQINGTNIVTNKIANIAVEGTYNASTNKIATQSTVTDAIGALDVNEFAQANIDTTTSGQTTLKINGIKEVDGKIGTGTSTTETDIVIDGTYDATNNKIATKSTVTTTVTNAIEALDSTATIASQSGNVVTIKTGLTETDGVITNDSGTDIVLEEVAVTGAAADVSIADAEGHTDQTTVEGALDEIYDRIEAMEGSFDVIVSTNAGNTPAGVKWGDPEITGTLAASANTFHKIYLVPAGGSETSNTYSEYITTRQNTGTEQSPVYSYGWEKLGDIAVDLTGYVKSVTVNGKSYTVDTNSTNITLTDVITAINGETAISGGDGNMVKVSATTTKDTTNGTNVTTLSTTVKIEEVADGLTKDSTPQYSSGHYVIENGKLVSAENKSNVPTYTISANDGLVKASDAKAYVDSAIADASFKWTEWS